MMPVRSRSAFSVMVLRFGIDGSIWIGNGRIFGVDYRANVFIVVRGCLLL